MGQYEISAKEVRAYDARDCVRFLRTKEEFGGLSNMAAGFEVIVNGVKIRNAEALYQACRFPLHAEIQEDIIRQGSPIAAKMKAKKHLSECRQDWMRCHLQIMRWVLKVKLCQNQEKFGKLLLSTGDKDIVEESSKNDWYWGAVPLGKSVLVGGNILGRLLMELRNTFVADKESFAVVPSLLIEDFLLYNDKIKEVKATK